MLSFLLPSFVSILADKLPRCPSGIPASSVFSHLLSTHVLRFPPGFSSTLGSFPGLQPHPSTISRGSGVPHPHGAREQRPC